MAAGPDTGGYSHCTAGEDASGLESQIAEHASGSTGEVAVSRKGVCLRLSTTCSLICLQ